MEYFRSVLCMYSRTSMARTLMARPPAVSNSFLSPLEKSHSDRLKVIKGDFSFLY